MLTVSSTYTTTRLPTKNNVPPETDDVRSILYWSPPTSLPPSSTGDVSGGNSVPIEEVTTAPESRKTVAPTPQTDLSPSDVAEIPPEHVSLPSISGFAPSRAGFILPDGRTLSPGSATTFTGLPLSLPAGAPSIVPINKPVPVTIFSALPSSMFFRIAPSNAGIILPSGQTLLKGSETTLAGVVLSLPTGPAGVVFINNEPVPITALQTLDVGEVSIGTAAAPMAAFRDQLLSESSVLVLPDGQILRPGSSANFRGHNIEFVKGGSAIKVDGVEVGTQIPVMRDGRIVAGILQLPDGQYLILAPEEKDIRRLASSIGFALQNPASASAISSVNVTRSGMTRVAIEVQNVTQSRTKEKVTDRTASKTETKPTGTIVGNSEATGPRARQSWILMFLVLCFVWVAGTH